MANKHGLTVRVLATTGDVNLFEYGGGVVYAASQSHGATRWISWEFWEPLSDAENANSVVDVYRVNVEDDLVQQFNADMVTKPSSTVGISKADLLAGARSKTLIQRVLTFEAMIQYYGPYEFDQAPVKMTVRELQKRWGKAVDGFRKRQRQPSPGRVRAAEPGAVSGAKPKPAKPSGAATKTRDRVHLVKTSDGVRVRVSGRGKEDYPVMHAAGTVAWRHPQHWSAETKKRAARQLLELKAKLADHVKINAPPAPKVAAKPKPAKAPKAPKPKAPKKPKARKAPKPKAAKKPKAPKSSPRPAQKYHKGDHVAVPGMLGVYGVVGSAEWSDTHKTYKYNVHFSGKERQAQAGGKNKWLLEGHLVKVSAADYAKYVTKPKAAKKPKARKAPKPKAAKKPKARKAPKPKAAKKPKARKAPKPKAAKKPKARKAPKPKAAKKPKARKVGKAKSKAARRVKPQKGAKVASGKPKAKGKGKGKGKGKKPSHPKTSKR